MLHKKSMKGAVMAVALSAGAWAMTTNAAHAEDPCKVFLCMAGKVMGSGGGSECHSSEKEFFKIKKKHHHPSISKTLKYRTNLIHSCPGADPKIAAKIISKFGTII